MRRVYQVTAGERVILVEQALPAQTFDPQADTSARRSRSNQSGYSPRLRALQRFGYEMVAELEFEVEVEDVTTPRGIEDSRALRDHLDATFTQVWRVASAPVIEDLYRAADEDRDDATRASVLVALPYWQSASFAAGQRQARPWGGDLNAVLAAYPHQLVDTAASRGPTAGALVAVVPDRVASWVGEHYPGATTLALDAPSSQLVRPWDRALLATVCGAWSALGGPVTNDLLSAAWLATRGTGHGQPT